MVPDVAAALERVVARLDAGMLRPGQVTMAEAVAHAIASGDHLFVQAGTGTGKSLGYLVPAILSGKTTVVATATKALQEQLTGKDLPFLRSALGVDFSYALLKGRSNYLCLARALESNRDREGRLLDVEPDDPQVLAVLAWAPKTETGDRADLPATVSNALWSAMSVSARECPGAAKCAQGADCFAERAKQRAADADVIVVNTHLYGVHLATGGFVLPEHEVVVIDEAHSLEDVATDSFGLELGSTRTTYLTVALRAFFTRDAATTADAVDAAGIAFERALEPFTDQRIDAGRGDIGPALVRVSEAVSMARRQVADVPPGGAGDNRRSRLLQLCDALLVDLRRVEGAGDGDVAWVARTPAPVLRMAPVDVGPVLAERLFAEHTVVLTSATLSVGGEFTNLAHRLGLRAPAGGDDDEPPAERPHYTAIDVGSPFAFEEQALLYCAAHLPDPRADSFAAAMAEELTALIAAAGGRTLALFTSRRALEAAARAITGTVPYRVLVQDELPRPRLVAAFTEDESSCLFATMSFWQGVDVPGPALSLVAIDRLPFPRPDDPLLTARRDAARKRGQDPFRTVDVDRAATLLAQGAGRLIRTATDRGVVAVFDRRLATGGYRWALLNSLPPLRRTRDPEEAREFLRALHTDACRPRPM